VRNSSPWKEWGTRRIVNACLDEKGKGELNCLPFGVERAKNALIPLKKRETKPRRRLKPRQRGRTKICTGIIVGRKRRRSTTIFKKVGRENFRLQQGEKEKPLHNRTHRHQKRGGVLVLRSFSEGREKGGRKAPCR